MIKKITLVIPIHNEINNLKILIPELINNIKIINNDFEIILVNDFSTDDSLKFCNSLITKDLNYEIKIINFVKRSGQSGAFKEAFKIATGEYIIKMDADMQDHPKDIKLFINKINENYDVIIGDRVMRKHNLFLFLAGKTFDLIIKISFIIKKLIFHSFLKTYTGSFDALKTYTGSFAAYRKKYVSDIHWYKNDHRYLHIIALQKGAKNFCNVPVSHRRRKYGISKYNTLIKLITGIPEIIFFIIRVFSGRYK